MAGIPCDSRYGRAPAIERSEIELVWPTNLFAQEARALLEAGHDSAETLGFLLAEARAATATIRCKLITVPARIATSARRLHLHLPRGWP